jgi:hypothetical protein
MSDRPDAVTAPPPRVALGKAPILAVEGLSKSFGAVEALRDVDFSVNADARSWRSWATTAPASPPW